MSVSAQLIKQLRDKTGAGLMDVRNALTEADGDETKAMELLRQKGAATAEKKSARATGEGKVKAAVADDGRCGALVEVNCETDFSANNERFVGLVDAIAEAANSKNFASAEELMATAHPEAGDLKTLLTDTVGAVKENMTLSRFERFELPEGQAGVVHAYIHAGGKIGVLIEAKSQKAESASNEAFRTLVKDLAMQIAAVAPEYVSRDEIPKEIIDEETRVEMGKEDIQSKPEAIRPKIVEGRVEKNLAQRVLMLQPFIKDQSQTVDALVKAIAKQLDDEVSITRFVRYVLGESQPATEETSEEAAVASV